LHLLLEVQGLRPQGAALFTVLAELYSNALEHGVLGLESSLKANAEGFADYYRQRSDRLAHLTDGFVRFHLHLLPDGGGGRLRLRVEDSGAGFDPQLLLPQPDDASRLSGRGLALVRQLSECCQWGDGEPGVCVEFSWKAGA
jgi:anti-sigma regulatory factor (Ser/Thr protein kinase)